MNGFAKVSPKNVGEEGEVLNVKGAVESELLPQYVGFFPGGQRIQQKRYRIPKNVRYEENDDRDPHDHQEGME